MSNELRIGVIGCGGRGGLAGHAHKPDDGVKLVAATDIREDARNKFKEKYGEDTYVTDDYKDMLANGNVDAVFVCTPDFLHEKHAAAALEAGKSVYLEKPMTITIEGCDRLLRLAYEHKVKLYLGHNMRHMNFIQQMRQLILDGKIGQPMVAWCRHFVGAGGDFYFKDWHAEREKSTSLLLQKGAHDIDVIHWLCGGYTEEVNAMGALTLYDQIEDRHPEDEPGDPWHEYGKYWPPLTNKRMHPIINVEDISMMQMRLDNGVYASYQQCHYSPDYWRNYTVIGTEGRIENFGNGEDGTKICIWNKRGGWSAEGHEQVEALATKGGHGGADPNIVGEFVRYVREGGKIKTSAIAARNSVAAGCKAAESLRSNGARLTIPPVDFDIRHYFEDDVEE